MESWKAEIYNRYSANFGRNDTPDTYRQYIPMGKRILKKCFPSDMRIRILDMGCGKGGFLKVFYDAGYRDITGVDVSGEEVKTARQMGLDQVRQGDLLETLKNSVNESYDLVLFLDVLEHFRRDETITILKETCRVLRKGGSVIIHVPNAEGLFGSRIRYADITHEQAFTSGSLAQICRHSGFSVFESYEDKPIVHNVTSFFRRVIWEIFTLPHRLLFAAETGTFSVILSQNLLFKASKT